MMIKKIEITKLIIMIIMTIIIMIMMKKIGILKIVMMIMMKIMMKIMKMSIVKIYMNK